MLFDLENRSCSLGAVTLKNFIVPNSSVFARNKTAPTSPTDANSSPPSGKRNESPKEKNSLLSTISQQLHMQKAIQEDNEMSNLETKTMPEQIQEADSQKSKSSNTNAKNSVEYQSNLMAQKCLRESNETSASDNSLHQTKCFTKRNIGLPRNRHRKSSCRIV